MIKTNVCFFHFFNLGVFIFGLSLLGIGIWMCGDKYVLSYFTVLVRNVDDHVLSAAPILLLVCGLITLACCFLGVYAVRRKSKGLIGIYALILVIVMIMELVAGFSVVVFRQDIHRHLKAGMQHQIINSYEFDNHIGKAWNYIQVRKKCCGANGPTDYVDSDWFFENNGITSQYSTFVPPSCCQLDFNQARDTSRVDPQKAVAKDDRKCQQDAEGNVSKSDYLHNDGCFATLLDIVWKHITVIIVFGLVVGFMQIVGCTSSCALMNDKTFH